MPCIPEELGRCSWDKVFKSELSKFFKGCLPQNLHNPIFNTLFHIFTSEGGFFYSGTERTTRGNAAYYSQADMTSRSFQIHPLILSKQNPVASY